MTVVLLALVTLLLIFVVVLKESVESLRGTAERASQTAHNAYLIAMAVADEVDHLPTLEWAKVVTPGDVLVVGFPDASQMDVEQLEQFMADLRRKVPALRVVVVNGAGVEVLSSGPERERDG